MRSRQEGYVYVCASEGVAELLRRALEGQRPGCAVVATPEQVAILRDGMVAIPMHVAEEEDLRVTIPEAN